MSTWNASSSFLVFANYYQLIYRTLFPVMLKIQTCWIHLALMSCRLHSRNETVSEHEFGRLLKRILSSVWISIKQSVMVSGIVYVFLGAPHWGIDNYRQFVSFLILLEIGWKVSTCIRTTPVQSFLTQPTHSIAIIKSPNALYMSIIGWGLLGSAWKS